MRDEECKVGWAAGTRHYTKKKEKKTYQKTLIGEMVDEVQQQQDEHLKGTR